MQVVVDAKCLTAFSNFSTEQLVSDTVCCDCKVCMLTISEVRM